MNGTTTSRPSANPATLTAALMMDSFVGLLDSSIQASRPQVVRVASAGEDDLERDLRRAEPDTVVSSPGI